MAYTKLQFKPGIVRDITRYSNNGGWFDSNRIRFRMGFPETIGGWVRLTNTTILGTCRSLHNWSNLSGTSFIGAGTNLKFYVLAGNFPKILLLLGPATGPLRSQPQMAPTLYV